MAERLGFDSHVVRVSVGEYVEIEVSFDERIDVAPAANQVTWADVVSLDLASAAPPGLAFSKTASRFYGTPSAVGFFGVSFKAVAVADDGDLYYNQQISQNYTIIATVNDSPPSTTVSVDTGEVDDAGDPIFEEESVMTGVAGEIYDTFALEIDFDLNTKKLSLPGLATQGGGGSSSSASGNGHSEEQPVEREQFFTKLSRNERYTWAIGLMKNGILQDIPLSNIDVTFKHFEPELKVVNLGENDLTLAGDGRGTRRYLTTVFVDGDQISNLLRRGTDLETTYIDGRLEVEVELGADAGNYLAVQNRTINNMSGGDVYRQVYTFDLSTIWDNSWDTVIFDLTTDLNVSQHAALNSQVTTEVEVRKNGSLFEVVGTNPPVYVEEITSSASASDWGVTHRISNVHQMVNGIVVDVDLITSSQAYGSIVELESYDFYVQEMYDNTGSPSGDYELYINQPTNFEFRANGNVIGTWVDDASGSPYTAAQIAASIGAALNVAVTVSFSYSGNRISVSFPTLTFDEVYDYNYGGTSYASPMQGGSTYSGVEHTATLNGRSQPGLQQRRISDPEVVRVFRDHE